MYQFLLKRISLLLAFIAFSAIAVADNSTSLQAIFVYTPTSGQVLLSGNTTNVSWANSTGTTTSYYIDYSTDNAATFTFIAYHSANTTVANFTWAIPYTPSTQCFIRIRKTNDFASNGISPMFTISTPPPSITLVNPSGSPTYTAGGLTNIIWGYYGFTQLDILFSSDGGTTWSMVAQGQFANTSYYTWTIPSITSNTCKIKIRNSADTTLYAQSPTNFSIIIPNITINVPNGGQSWSANSTRTIYWSSTILSGTNVNVEYSIDSGATWQGVAYGIYNLGSRTWVVPNTSSTKCFIKVTDAANPNTFDVSNAPFTITALPGTLSLYTFVSSTFAEAGTSQPILYTYNNVSSVNIEYSVDGGATWIYIIVNTPATGSYSWTIPYNVSTNCFIRISNAINASEYSQNINPFTIFVPSLTILTPNGSEVLQGYSNYTISWAGIPSQYYVLLQYQTAPNAAWQDIAITTSSGFNNVNTYVWSVPNISSSTCKVRILDTNNTTIVDESNATFTINQVAKQINLTMPYGGQTFATNTQVQIQWSLVAIDSLNLYFSSDGGTSWQLIATNVVSNSGSSGNSTLGYYNWITPNLFSNNCIIKIEDATDNAYHSQNTTPFILANPYINITNPNGEEVLTGGSTYYVQFYNSGTGNVNLFFSANAGLTWDTIATNQWQGTNGSTVNTYTWLVPNINSTQCLIKIQDLQGQVIDISDSTFTINSSITKTQNNFDDTQVLVYPNPAQDHISILCSNTYNSKISITDLLGNVVLQENLASNQQSYPITGITKGIYNLAITQNNQIVHLKKLIIQ